MTHNKINYLDLFHKHGFRITHQRQAVLDAVCQANGHVTISQIIFQTRKLDRGIDQSTVYRSLELFEKLGLVIPGEKVNGEQTFEIVQESRHHHLICTNCGNEVEIDDEIVDDFYRQLKSAYGFDVRMDHLIVLGVCGNCTNQ
jgi:Fur family ferric uptake transcriptional regulator